MKLSIIIASFNTKNLTRSCLSSIYKYPPKGTFEIIVIDNASKDGSVQMIKKEFPKVKLIENNKNLGFAKANNLGVKIAKGEFILLLNSDTKVLKTSIDFLVDYLKDHPDVGVATSKLQKPDGSTQYYYHRRFPTFFSFVSSVLEHYFGLANPFAKKYFMLDSKLDRETKIEQAAGTVFATKKEVISKIGGLFDHKLPLFFNDSDFCKRVKDHSLKVILLPQASVIHLGGKSTDLLDPYVLREELFVSMLYYFRKHRQFLSYALSKISIIMLLPMIFLLTTFGIPKSYFEAPIDKKKSSLVKQAKIFLAVIIERRQISDFN